MKLLPGNRRQFSRLPVLCAGALALAFLIPPLQARWGSDGLPVDGHQALASYYLRHGQFMEAEAELRTALDGYLTWGGDVPRRMVECRERLAQALIAQREFAQAEAEYRIILAIRRQNGPEDQRKTLFYQANLGAVFLIQGKIDELRKLVEIISPEAQRLLRPDDRTRLGIEWLQKAAEWKEPAEP